MGFGGTGGHLVEINISLVFFSFIFILLSLDQSMIMSVVSCRCEGERLLTLSDNLVSSTYITDLMVSAWGMSLINTTNESGPRYEPCGIAASMVSQSDTSWPSFTLCCLSDRKACSQQSSMSWIPKLANFSIRMLWSTKSNALL